MRKRLTLLGMAAAAVLLATSAFAANRGVTFTSIGFYDPNVTFPGSNVMAMNPQGTVFLVSPNYNGVGYAFKWTRDGGWGEAIGSMDNLPRMSYQGTIMANGLYPGGNYGWPATWTGMVEGWDPIPNDPDYAPCGGSRMSFYDMGGNGDFATGLTWHGCSDAEGFLWNKATNTTIALGRPNGKSTRGNAVTADGSKVIGWGTMLYGSRRGASWQNGTWTFLGDPNGTEPKVCAGSGKSCTSDSADPLTGCPGEYVDDGHCIDKGTCEDIGACVANVCVGGINAGNSCTSRYQCPGSCTGGSNPGASCTSNSSCAGTCTGPNAGATCTSDYYCPDTAVCLANPAWNDDLFKGEAFDVTDDGRYAVGQYFNSGDKQRSGYRLNPDGSFTEIPPPEDFIDAVLPGAVSQDGKTAVGRVGNPFFGSIPFFWREGIGTVDLQLFLVEQGLDELFFWRLTDLYTVSADGTVLGGRGFNPDGWYEGIIVDIKKVWVCHMPPGQPENKRTLGIALSDVPNHLAHGDFLGTCEFLDSGGLSRAAALRERLSENTSSEHPESNSVNPMSGLGMEGATCNNVTTSAPPQGGINVAPDDPVVSRPGIAPTPQSRRIIDTRDRIRNKTRTND